MTTQRTLAVRDVDGTTRRLPARDVMQAARREARRKLTGKQLRNSADSERVICDLFAGCERERFAVAFLTCRNRLIAWRFMFEGTLDSAMVYPREIVKAALECNAAAVILAHNHPSGVAEPSQADHLITQRIQKALELIDVRVLDHFIAGAGEVTSLARLGVL